jgi:hypothetical protein
LCSPSNREDGGGDDQVITKADKVADVKSKGKKEEGVSNERKENRRNERPDNLQTHDKATMKK